MMRDPEGRWLESLVDLTVVILLLAGAGQLLLELGRAFS